MKIRILEDVLLLNVVLWFAALLFPFPEMSNPRFWNGVLVLYIGLIAFGSVCLFLWRGRSNLEGFAILNLKGFAVIAIVPVVVIAMGFWRMFVY